MSEKLITLSFSHKMFFKIVSKPMPLRNSLTFPHKREREREREREILKLLRTIINLT